MAVQKFLPTILEGSTVIITSKDREDICTELNHDISALIHAHPHELKSDDSSEDHKDVFVELLQVPGMILVVTPDYYYQGLACLESAQNFIVIASTRDSEFLSKCRNLILEANPKFTMIKHCGNLEFIDPFFEMIPVEYD